MMTGIFLALRDSQNTSSFRNESHYTPFEPVQPYQPKMWFLRYSTSSIIVTRSPSGPLCLRRFLLRFFGPMRECREYGIHAAYIAGILVRVINFSDVVIKLSRLARAVALSPRGHKCTQQNAADGTHNWSTDRLTAKHFCAPSLMY
jgi:hypothetical protein